MFMVGVLGLDGVVEHLEAVRGVRGQAVGEKSSLPISTK